jgi:pyruvate dehydrogenase E1 component alpha subunit
MRMHGHGAHDDMRYVPKEMFEEWERRDPIDRYTERLIADHGFSTEETDGIRSEVRALVDECAAKALASPMPDPRLAAEGVFADAWEPLEDGRAPWSFWAQRDRANGDGAGANGGGRS